MRNSLRMGRKEKLLEKLRNQPSDGNWTLVEVEALISFYGFALDRTSGSHRVYISADFDEPLVLAPHGTQIKRGYIRELRSRLLP